MNSTQLLEIGAKTLKNNKVISYRLDSEIILSQILKISRENLLIKEYNISDIKIIKFKSLISRRSKQEPIAYIFKKKEFRSRDFFIDNKSLIPRPETELLIDPIIKIFKNKNLFFLDVGVGSGCITYSILNEIKQSRGLGIDISKKSLINAKINLKKFKNRAKLMKRSIDDITHTKFDLIVSNPPYIVKREINRLSQDIKKYEPRIALDGGNDGLDVVKKVIYKAKNILKSNGILALEIGTGQYLSVTKLLKACNFRKKIIIKDYKNNVRCIFSTL
tara:strand:- start:1376 stop:2203 length:828 start_codon:yes stop_codon:yes gene_type:complete